MFCLLSLGWGLIDIPVYILIFLYTADCCVYCTPHPKVLLFISPFVIFGDFSFPIEGTEVVYKKTEFFLEIFV